MRAGRQFQSEERLGVAELTVTDDYDFSRLSEAAALEGGRCVHKSSIRSQSNMAVAVVAGPPDRPVHQSLTDALAAQAPVRVDAPETWWPEEDPIEDAITNEVRNDWNSQEPEARDDFRPM